MADHLAHSLDEMLRLALIGAQMKKTCNATHVLAPFLG